MTTCTVIGLLVKCVLLAPLPAADAAAIVAKLPDRCCVVGDVLTLPPTPYVAPAQTISRQVPYEPTDPSPAGSTFRRGCLIHDYPCRVW